MRALVGAFCDLARDLCADDGGPAPDDVGEGPEGEAGPIDDAGEALAPVDDDAPLAPADDPNLARNSQWWQHESGAWRMGPSRRRSGYSVMVRRALALQVRRLSFEPSRRQSIYRGME
jgi:hypothetical protein